MINLDLVPVLQLLTNRYHLAGNVMILGRQEVGFSDDGYSLLKKTGVLLEGLEKDRSGKFTQEVILKSLGFDDVHSIDVSDFEGATHIIDLNTKNTLPDEVIEAYDLVLNGGTLEHCFDIVQSLRNTIGLIKPGGNFLHFGPMNNMVDHGFYQFSPTLWFDFLQLNGFEILVSASIKVVKEHSGETCYNLYPIEPFETAHLSMGGIEERLIQMVLARRLTDTPLTSQSPNQSFYAPKHGENLLHHEIGAFLPQTSKNGVITEDLKYLIPIDKTKITEIDFKFYEVDAPYRLENRTARPYLSKVVILENGVPLKYKMPLTSDITECLPGRFRHRGDKVAFSSSDGSSVSDNEYKYSLAGY